MSRSAPLFSEAPQPMQTITCYTDNSPLDESDWSAIYMAVLTAYSPAEPPSVTKARDRIEAARQTLDHFLKPRDREGNIYPPIFRSFEYEAFKIMGLV